jgi:hypothetical protein
MITSELFHRLADTIRNATLNICIGSKAQHSELLQKNVYDFF